MAIPQVHPKIWGMESLAIGNAPNNATALLLKCKVQVQCVASTNNSPFLLKCKQKSLVLTFRTGYCGKNGNGKNIRRGRATKWVYCARASQSRGPLWSGRVLNNEIMQSVQAMKRARGDQAKIERIFETRVYRLLKSDLLALLQELHRQDECHLALKVFDVVRKEIWYKPDLSLYVSVIMALKRNNLMEKVDSVFEELKKEPLQPDTKAFTRMLATFLRVGLPHHAIETYELMKQKQCKMDQYTFVVLINGLRRLRQPDLADAIGDEVLKAEAAAKVQRFTEWALKCIGSHSRGQGSADRVTHSSAIEIQLQLSAFKTFLDLAGDRLTGKDFTEAFDAACFPLTLFSSAIDPGWASGIAASAMQGLLGMLVEGGADNVNQCFLEAARFGSTELVRILLHIAQRNSLDVDVDLALGFASHYRKISTMECLVEEGNAVAFLGPLMRAAERGDMPVVKWFVERGCRDMELCLALTAAASSSKVEIATYLLPHVPQNVLSTLSVEIIKAAGERSGGSLKGVAFLLQADFLNNPEATYQAANNIAKSEDEAVTSELRTFLLENWSEEAFLRGRLFGQDHYLNVMRVIMRGLPPLYIQDLPNQLQVAIAYLPLYKECFDAGGVLLSQWLRGQLVEAAWRLSRGIFNSQEELLGCSKDDLLAILESNLPAFLLCNFY